MSDALDEAQTLYREALDASAEQRNQIAEDLEFTDPSNPQQWDGEERRQRESDPGGARPCLTLDQTGQYIANVAGQVEQRPPALHAIPAGGGAIKRVAEQLDGFYRHIEHVSRAQQHYVRALTSAARAGVGYLLVQPEYTDRALGYQEPRIGSEGDPLRVVFDPWSVELDGSDATFGFLLAPLSHREFERQFGAKAAKVSFGDESGRQSDDQRESILTATQWRVETKTRNMVFAVDLDSHDPEDVFALTEEEFWKQKQEMGRRIEATTDAAGRQNYSDKVRCVYWSRMSGAELLTKEREFPANWIGIVPVYGYVGFSGGRMKYCGIGRRAREGQRAYNYHNSEIRALMNDAPKSPWVAAERAIRNYKALWDRASVDRRAFLPFDDWDDENGRPIPPPQRAAVAINLQNHIQGVLQAREDIQASIGMYAANIGKQSNATSGVAYDAQKQQGEASTTHFPGNLAASVGHVGRICMDMIPRLIDTRRQLRILNVDKSSGAITIDPEQAEPLTETPQGLSINPNLGKYDVRSVVGPSFTTQRQESREEMREMMRSNPEMTPAVAPLWAQSLDIPNADKLAEVLTAIAPDPVKAILQPDKQESTAALKAQNEQLQQALQEATQLAQEAQAELDAKHAEDESKADETAIKAYDALTKRLQVMGATITPEAVQQIAMQTVMAAMHQPQPAEESSEIPAEHMPMAQPEPMPMGTQMPAQEGMPAEMPMDEQQPLVPEPMPPEMQEPPVPQQSPELQQVIAGQDRIAGLMTELIRILQTSPMQS